MSIFGDPRTVAGLLSLVVLVPAFAVSLYRRDWTIAAASGMMAAIVLSVLVS